MARRSRNGCGNWSENLVQLSSPTWFLNPCNIYNYYIHVNFIYTNFHSVITNGSYKGNNKRHSYLEKHFFEVRLWLGPGSYGVTEKDKVLHNPTGVHIDHVTHTTECRVFLFIVTNVTQGCAPVLKKKIISRKKIIHIKNTLNWK